MSFIQNIKQKLVKKVPETTSENVTFSQEDIAVLAYMSLTCKPIIVGGIFGKNVYSCYIPYDKADINLARQLFAKNGINMEKYTTTIISSDGLPALRHPINPQYETDDVYRFMCTVNERFWKQTRKEHLHLESVYNAMKAKQK